MRHQNKDVDISLLRQQVEHLKTSTYSNDKIIALNDKLRIQKNIVKSNQLKMAEMSACINRLEHENQTLRGSVHKPSVHDSMSLSHHAHNQSYYTDMPEMNEHLEGGVHRHRKISNHHMDTRPARATLHNAGQTHRPKATTYVQQTRPSGHGPQPSIGHGQRPVTFTPFEPAGHRPQPSIGHGQKPVSFTPSQPARHAPQPSAPSNLGGAIFHNVHRPDVSQAQNMPNRAPMMTGLDPVDTEDNP